MDTEKGIAIKIIIIMMVIQVIAGVIIYVEYDKNEAMTSLLYPLLIASASVFLLLRLLQLVNRMDTVEYSTDDGYYDNATKTYDGINVSKHGLKRGDIVYVRHIETNAEITRINQDHTYEVQTLLNQVYTVDINMIEPPTQNVEDKEDLS